jgi:hypothetical protein
VAVQVKRWLVLVAAALFLTSAAHAATAPDPTRRGPYAVGQGSYALPPRLDRELSDELKTDLNAAIWYPKNAPVSVPRPLLVFLHGNHSTCGYFDKELKIRVDDDTSYTYSGKCPKGYTQAPSHLGYAYLAQRLAAWGYVVVSINANRGVNAAPDTYDDPFLILRRGKLILRHLERLSAWNSSGGTPRSVGYDLRGRLDFANIGLFGHSRGGDAIVAAYKLASDKSSPWPRRLPPNTLIRGLFALAPTDAQEGEPKPINTAYAVLLPMCDGDVSDLEGLRFFERAMAAGEEERKSLKSTFAVWGTNHNYYNTEWQESDSSGCVGHKPLFDMSGGSEAQRETAIQPVMGFFRATVGRDANRVFARILDSSWYPAAPFRDLTEIERGWSSTPDPSWSWLLEDFEQERLKSKAGVAYQLTRMKAARITIPDHDKSGLALAWRDASPRKPSSVRITLAKTGRSIDMTGWSSVEIRMTVGCGGPLDDPDCYVRPPLKDGVQLQGDITLVDADGKRSTPVPIAPYAKLFAPVGVDYEDYYYIRHPVLSTVRIPSSAFQNIDLTKLRAIEFSFGQTSKAVAYLGDIRLSRSHATFPWGMKPKRAATVLTASAESANAQAANQETVAADRPAAQARMMDRSDDGAAVQIRRSAGKGKDGRSRALVEITVSSERPFSVTGNGMLLSIGDLKIRGGSFVRAGRTDQVMFRMTEERFNALPEGAPMVMFGLASQRPWSFGPLRKADVQ